MRDMILASYQFESQTRESRVTSVMRVCCQKSDPAATNALRALVCFQSKPFGLPVWLEPRSSQYNHESSSAVKRLGGSASVTSHTETLVTQDSRSD